MRRCFGRINVRTEECLVLNRLYPLIIFLMSFGIYVNTLQNDFVYDDFREVVNNPVVQDFQFNDFWRLYYKPHQPPPARPVPVITYALNFAADGLNPVGYHLINILLHGCVSILIYGVTARLFPRNHRLAFITALFFACHPIHSDVVAPVAGRSELLACVCFLSTLWIYVKKTEKPLSGWSMGFWFTLPIFFIGVMSKATAWSLPLALVGIDAYRFRSKNGEFAYWRSIFFDRLKKFYLPYTFFPVVIFILILLIGTSPTDEKSAANFLLYLPTHERIVTALGIMMRYLALLAFPLQLSCDYGFAHLSSQSPLVQTLWAAGGGTALLFAVSVGYVSFRREGRYFLAIFLFAATYTIVSNIVVVINTPMAERLIYLPSWGFCLLLAMGLEDLFIFLHERRCLKSAGFFLWFSALVVVAGYSTRTWLRNRDWRDQMTLMSAAYAVCPMSGRVNNNLGAAYEQRRQLDRAIFHYKKAASILPNHPNVLRGLGTAYAKAGHKKEAKEIFEKLVTLERNSAEVYFNLGKLCADLGLLDEAIGAFNRASAINPEDFDAWFNLGKLYQRKGRLKKALEAYGTGLEFKPDSWQVHYWVGNTNLENGENQRAARHYQKALFYRPRFKEAWNNLGVAQLYLGNKAKALTCFQKALQVDPNYAEARKNLEVLNKGQKR